MRGEAVSAGVSSAERRLWPDRSGKKPKPIYECPELALRQYRRRFGACTTGLRGGFGPGCVGDRRSVEEGPQRVVQADDAHSVGVHVGVGPEGLVRDDRAGEPDRGAR